MKKIISVILIAATLLTLFASCTKKEEPALKDENYEYVVLEDNTAKLTKFIGTTTHIKSNTDSESGYQMPTSIGGYTVTVIGENAFKDNAIIGVVTVPDTLKKIEPYAFANSSLKKIFINKADETTEIGEYAFAGCKNLVQADLPRNLVTLGDYAFQGCGNLKYVTFRGNTKNIGAYTFDACPKVELRVKEDATYVLDYLDTYPQIAREIKPATGK